MDKGIFCGTAAALQTMELPPADASFDDLLARLDAVPGIGDALGKPLQTMSATRGFKVEPPRLRRDAEPTHARSFRSAMRPRRRHLDQRSSVPELTCPFHAGRTLAGRAPPCS